MDLQNHFDDYNSDSEEDNDYIDEEDSQEFFKNKKRIRHLLEEKLERKRLKEELEDELNSDFNWNDIDL